MNALARAGALLLHPAAAWDEIERERMGVQDVYTRYVAVVAAVPAIAYFIGFSFVGTGIPAGGHRVPFAHGIAHMVAFYVLTLGIVYALAAFVNALAPAFGGERDFTRAFRVAAYAPTAMWLAGVFYVLPMVSILALAGLYSLYLLHVGLPRLMHAPPERALPFTFVVVLAAIVLVVGVDVLAAMMIPARYRGF